MGTNDGRLHYEVVERRARPARVAVLMDSMDAEWHHTAVRVIEFLSTIWGGRHSLIVPTDGSTISPTFWAILKKFSPDYVFFYGKTWNDVRISRSEEYAGYLHDHIAAAEAQSVVSAEEKNRIDQELRMAWASQFGLTPDLCSQIADRLVPFHFDKHFEPVMGHGHVPHELTSILDVLPYVDRPQSVVSFRVPAEIDAIWWVAHTGSYSSDVREKIESLGINTESVPVTEENAEGFARWIAGGEARPLRLSAEAGSGRPQFVPPDEKRPTPLMVSMSGLGLYGSALSHRAIAERFAYVIGDSLADFCLSYCLRRIGHQAVWLPAEWVAHFDTSDESLVKSCALSAVYARPYRAARNLGLKLCSTSMQPQAMEGVLDVLRKRFGLGLNGQQIDALSDIAVVALATDAPVPYCVDSPNQTEILPFLDLESVGAIRSPRPTGFSKLSAHNHRWIAEVNVVGRAVPAVPHVAEHLVKLPQSAGTYDTRVSQHALAYACPSGFVIGDDIKP